MLSSACERSERPAQKLRIRSECTNLKLVCHGLLSPSRAAKREAGHLSFLLLELDDTLEHIAVHISTRL